VYFGISFEDVNAAIVPTASGLDANSFDPGRLDFGQTYFWRVDEVNGAPDKTVFKGNTWSFEAEPYSIPIPGSAVTVTASSSTEISPAENTIDNSGLDPNNAHSFNNEDMWYSASGDPDPWIQYEFEAVKKLDGMNVWNSNSTSESVIGWGVKDVQIEYSTDGESWDVLEDANQFSRGPGSPTYNQYDEIAFNDVAAKYVRLNIQSNWGGVVQQYSLSEVQFFAIPTEARTPVPDSESVDILPDVVVSWRAGREAAQSTVYVSTDPNEVADGLAASATSNTNSLDLTSLDLRLGQTYYWRVDEVNEAEVEFVWAGPVWSFSTVAAIVVDDFESYGNNSPDRPFQTWLDGIGYSADEFFSVEYSGNGTGAAIGHDIWSGGSTHYNGDIMEKANTMAGSNQSMPFYYSNSGNVASQTDRSFTTPQDWTVNGIKTLAINFFGAAGNTGQLYLKINDTKVLYDLDATNITRASWQAWNIDLSSVDDNLQNVTQLTVGIEGSSTSGLIYIDDIRLYPKAGELILPVDPGTTSLVSHYALDGDFRDSVGSHDGVALDNPQFTTDPARGQVLSLEGATSAVEVPYSADLNPEAFTVSLWVNADPSGSGHRSPITSRDDSPQSGYIFYANPNNIWEFWIGTGSRWNIVSGPAVALGEWTHLAASYVNEQSRLYVNGFLAGEATAPISLNTQRPLRIGAGATEQDPLLFFQGNIDDVRIYNQAISHGEILWLSDAELPIHKPF